MRLYSYLIRAKKAPILWSSKSDAIVWKIALRTDFYCLTIIQFQIHSCNQERYFAPFNLSKNMKNELFLSHQSMPGKQIKQGQCNKLKGIRHVFYVCTVFARLPWITGYPNHLNWDWSGCAESQQVRKDLNAAHLLMGIWFISHSPKLNQWTKKYYT